MEWYKEPGKIYIKDNNDIVVGKITFTDLQDGRVNIESTVVAEAMQGQGIASQLVGAAVDEILREGKKVTASCPYAARWLEEHPGRTGFYTHRLYIEDAFCREFDAHVTGCISEKGGCRIALDRSAFYPEGGGQPGDRGLLYILSEIQNETAGLPYRGIDRSSGASPALDTAGSDKAGSDKAVTGEGRSEETLQGQADQSGELLRQTQVQITDTQEKDGIVWHYADVPLEPGTSVHGRIDWRFRFDLMQNHSGEHLVSGLIHEMFGYDNVGFHMGSDFITIDLNGELTVEQLAAVEERANEAVWQDLPVQIKNCSSEEAKQEVYRSKKEISGQVRIVTVPGVDSCACCGTHVRSTGQIGLIRLFTCQKFREGVRIELLCGRRAMEYLRQVWEQNHQISMELSAKPLETAAAAKRMKESEGNARYRVCQLEMEHLRAFVKEQKGEGDLLIAAQDLDAELTCRLAVELMEQREGLCAVFSGGEEQGYKYALGRRGADLRSLVKELNAQLGGRGGGQPHFAQGSVRGKMEQIRDFFRAHTDQLTERIYR